MTAAGVEFGFVAAMEREVAAVVRGWRRERVQAAEWRCEAFLAPGQRAALVCAGTGAERAYEAAKLLVERYGARKLVSLGFAGACVSQLRPGAVVVPAKVVEAASGREHACALGRGTLVSARGVAGVGAKRDAHLQYGALAVEMEAAGVAAAAAKFEAGFAAIKAISDGAEEELTFLSGFVTPEGFATGRFARHIALRPGLWSRVAALRRNSRLAAAALAGAVGECMGDWQGFAARHASDKELLTSASPRAGEGTGEGRSA